MATTPNALTMSIEEYLHTAFSPDVDYVDGWIEERNLWERDHARLQTILANMLMHSESEWNTETMTEVRVQVAARLFRVPDICLVDARGEVEQIVRTPPLLCVEVVSPEDRLPRLLERAKDFHRMGVPVVWVFDPETKMVWVSSPSGAEAHAGGMLWVQGTLIELDPMTAFQRLTRRS